MEQERPAYVDPSAVREARTRKVAGKALLVFIALMVAVTWAGQMLQEMTIATVSPTTPQRGALELQIDASGTLSAAATAPVLLTESARVTEVPAEQGSQVAAGDPLFRLDYTDLVKTKRDAVVTAETNLANKQRTLDWAAADLGQAAVTRVTERQASVAKLYDAWQSATGDAAAQAKLAYESEKRRLDADSARDVLTKVEDVETARDSYDDAVADYLEILSALDGVTPPENIAAALSAYDPAATYIHTVVSPVSGSVLTNTASVGTTVSTNGPVATVNDLTGGLSLIVSLSEDDAGEMAAGETATVTVGSVQYTCPIISIAASTAKEGMFDVRFLLPGDAGAVGMSASMRYRKRTQNYDVLIPLSALRSDSEGDFVFIVEQQQSSLGAKMVVRRVDIDVLDRDSSRAALQGGISQRDQIVERSDRNISDGDRVRVSEG